MKDIIEDLIKIYLSSIDSYNSKIYQTINDKYTIIDRSMIAAYLYVKIIEDRNEQNKDSIDVLSNYLLKQMIYGETGSLAFEIEDKSKHELYHEILDKLVLEKFEYKNRIMKELKYSYKNIAVNKYSNLLTFLEKISEFAIFHKMILRGNKEAVPLYEDVKNKIINQFEEIDEEDHFYNEKKIITNLIVDNQFDESQYGKLTSVALNLKDVYRFSQVPMQFPENVLFHQYSLAVASLIFIRYCNSKLGEEFDEYKIIVKCLFHDFGEYKGTEIITAFKNYNDVTKKMFAEIEAKDEKDLEAQIGTNLYNIISEYKQGAEGYISEMLDKIIAILRLWVEVGYYHNFTFIKTIDAIYQDRFKRFLRIEKMNEFKNKTFYMDFLREGYIYPKEHLIECDLEYFFKYFTEEELEQFRNEIKLLKSEPEIFLK